MINKLSISFSSVIRSGTATCNRALWHQTDNLYDFNEFSRSVYKKLNLSYPKFYKMDNLCKLAILGSELLFAKSDNRQLINGKKIAVVLSNKASSMDTDRLFNDSIEDEVNYFPSPAVFVYTLPNIAIGEICIKNLIKGENAFFIFDRFDSGFIYDYVTELLINNRAEGCICGWCDFDNSNCDALFMYVEKMKNEDDEILFSVENIDKLYKNKS